MFEESDYQDDFVNQFTSLHQDLHNVDTTFDRTAIIRNKIIDKLAHSVTEMDLNVDALPSKDLEARIAAVNALTSQLDSLDKQAINRANMKLKVKAGEDQSDYNKAVAEFLSKLPNNVRCNVASSDDVCDIDDDAIDAELEHIFEESEMLILDSELREDSTDLS